MIKFIRAWREIVEKEGGCSVKFYAGTNGAGLIGSLVVRSYLWREGGYSKFLGPQF
jgi:hypothetical protein